MRLALVLVLALALAAASAAAAPVKPSIPSAEGFVNDFAGVLDDASEAHLESLIAELQSKTESEIAVVTVATTAPLDDFDYAMAIAEAWKPGDAKKDNGVVFLVVVNDRKVRILTGYGIEGALPDGLVGEIQDRLIVPRFRQGDYAGGVRAGTEELALRIAREYGVTLSVEPRLPRAQRRPAPAGVPLWLAMLVIAASCVVLLAAAASAPRARRSRRGGLFGDSFGGGGFGGHGGGFGGLGGGGFGGFGGGGFGGGGAGRSW